MTIAACDLMRCNEKQMGISIHQVCKCMKFSGSAYIHALKTHSQPGKLYQTMYMQGGLVSSHFLWS